MTNERAIFAGGCFWCMVKPFDQQPGIVSVTSGYTGGHTVQPTYEEVCSGKSGHTEAVEIVFEPEIISYQELVEIYWRQTDPTDAFGQFQDRGDSYRPVIYYTSDEQRKSAVASKEKLEKSGKYPEPIVTTIEAATVFYPAESYHQDYYLRNPERYETETKERQAFIKKQWGEKE